MDFADDLADLNTRIEGMRYRRPEDLDWSSSDDEDVHGSEEENLRWHRWRAFSKHNEQVE